MRHGLFSRALRIRLRVRLSLLKFIFLKDMKRILRTLGIIDDMDS